MKKEVVLTKDNLARQNWDGSKKCCFCRRDDQPHMPQTRNGSHGDLCQPQMEI
jgi:hypothetical protein